MKRATMLVSALAVAALGCQQQQTVNTKQECDHRCEPGFVCNSSGYCASGGGVGGSTGGSGGPGAIQATNGIPATPPAGTVGLHGGEVDRLYFAMTGDTRPHDCDQTQAYPKDPIRQIATTMGKLGVQFAVDLGDHMFVCNGDAAEARTQMGFYTDAIKAFPRAFFMTMGNHECGSYGCAVTGGDANMDAYLEALKPTSTLPYYSFDVKTKAGLATFVVISDDAWDGAAAAWLETTLARADRDAKYTFVERHHPVLGTRTGSSAIIATIFRHRYSLILTAHSHDYEHTANDSTGGRAVVVGLGGANAYNAGFGTVLQQEDGSLTFVLYDSTGNPGDSWSVTARN